jgi:hypothetical protein
MAWHLGYPLSQTLFTSVYIEKMLQTSPETIQDADFIKNRPADAPRDPMHGALRAYCLGVVKACCYVNERIRSEHSYEVSVSLLLGSSGSTDVRQGRGLRHKHI